MMRVPVLFIDDGGVMNDNALRGPQWQRLVGEFFAPLLGGSSARWAEANRTVVDRQIEAYREIEGDQVDAEFDAFARTEELDWLRWMCQEVGVPVPSDDECLALTDRAIRHITPRVEAAYPGAARAICTLHERGYRLHTASGEPSVTLDGALRAMGVRDCFDRLYGADLIRALKTGPAYFARVFADSGVDPADALVVDDKPAVLAWAARFGARTAVVGTTTGDFEPDLRVRSLAELPDVIGNVSRLI